MRLPNLLIVGAQKSGTTWLHASLRTSAHVFGSTPKELNFFNKPNFASRLDAYSASFPEKIGAIYYMESTPHYFQLPREGHDIATSIKKHLNNPKIIVVLRNPVDRYESAMIHHMMKGRVTYSPTIDTISDDRMMIRLGLYGEILAYWRGIFPDMAVYFYDDINSNPMRFLDGVFSYLGIENDLLPGDVDFRTNDKTIKIKKVAPDWEKMPELSERARHQLLEIYQSDIVLLERITGRDLSSWLLPVTTDRTAEQALKEG